MQTVDLVPLSHQQDATIVAVVVDVEPLNRRTTDGCHSD